MCFLDVVDESDVARSGEYGAASPR
jgi:hypothetical protein